MEETCAYIAEGFIADPSDCKGYGYCKDGKLVTKGTCPNGYVYNSKDGTCDYPSRSKCSVANVKSICSTVKDGDVFADPDNCNRYCQCQNGVPVCNNCPPDQVYNKGRCTWRSNLALPCVSDSICRLVQDAVFAGNPEGCGEYVSCSGGTGQAANCTENYYFNPLIGMCQEGNPCKNENTNTPGGSSPPGAGIKYDLPNDTSKCESYNTSKGGSQFFADGKTCFGYYACANNAGPGIWTKCPVGLHFNGEKQECVTPYTFQCKYDRCGNIPQEFVGAVGPTCKNYLYCKDQVAVSPGDNYAGTPCQSGFFNEFVGGCVPSDPANNPEYIICSKTPSTQGQ